MLSSGKFIPPLAPFTPRTPLAPGKVALPQTCLNLGFSGHLVDKTLDNHKLCPTPTFFLINEGFSTSKRARRDVQLYVGFGLWADTTLTKLRCSIRSGIVGRRGAADIKQTIETLGFFGGEGGGCLFWG